MKLTKEECELALEEYDFRSERPLPHEYALLRQLIEEHFDNKSLMFEDLERGIPVWDNEEVHWWFVRHKKEDYVILAQADYRDEVIYKHEFEENRFYRREVKE